MTDAEPQFLEVGDGDVRRIAYLADRGEARRAPGIVWLGGLKSDMTGTKASALAAWARQTRISYLRFDYSGHGQSSGVFEESTTGQWLQDSLAILDHACQGPQILVGSSLGGWIALLVMRALAGGKPAHPFTIAGAVLIAPAWDMTETLMWQRFSEETRRTIKEEGTYHRPSAYGDAPYVISKALIEEGRRHLMKGKHFDPGAPVRIIQGMADPDVPFEHVLGLFDVITRGDVTLTLVKDGKHSMSRPQDLDLLIREIEILWEAARVAGSSAAIVSPRQTP